METKLNFSVYDFKKIFLHAQIVYTVYFDEIRRGSPELIENCLVSRSNSSPTADGSKPARLCTFTTENTDYTRLGFKAVVRERDRAL